MRLQGAHRLLGVALALGLGVLVAGDTRAQTPEIQMSVTGKASGSASSMKVPEEFHAALTEEDFNEDVSGEKHRDPFQSYMTPSSGPMPTQPGADNGSRKVIAAKASLAELELTAIVKKKGGKFYAMFDDRTGRGHVAQSGDFLTKDEFRVKDVTANVVIIELGVMGADQRPLTQELKLFPEERRAPRTRGRPLLTDQEDQ